MIATLDRLKTLDGKLEELQSRLLMDSFDSKINLAPAFFERNEVALMRRLIKDYLEESEEVLAIGQLQNYNE